MIIIAMALLFSLWGIFIFFAVGEKGPVSWNFGVIKDTPGESPYATYQPGQVSSSSAPEKQHVSGKPAEVMTDQKKGSR